MHAMRKILEVTSGLSLAKELNCEQDQSQMARGLKEYIIVCHAKAMCSKNWALYHRVASSYLNLAQELLPY